MVINILPWMNRSLFDLYMSFTQVLDSLVKETIKPYLKE